MMCLTFLAYSDSLAANAPYQYIDEDNGVTYRFSFCNTITCSGSSNGTMATKVLSGALGSCLKAYGSPSQVTVSTLPSSDNVRDGLTLKYSGGPLCSGQPSQSSSSVVYTLHCGAAGDSSPLSNIKLGSATDDCTLYIEATTPAACLTPIPEPEHHISGGWVFVIILFTVLTTYCGLGMLYKGLCRRATGMEIVPNVDFWRGAWDNVQLGASVAWAKLTCSESPTVGDSVYQGLDDDLGLGGDYYAAKPETSGTVPHAQLG